MTDGAGQGPWVGRPMRRLEDERLLRGQGVFADDPAIAGEAHAVIVRSPHAHAEIGAIDRAAALALPGVLGVFTAPDLRADGLGPIPFFTKVAGVDGRPVAPPPCLALAEGLARHVGEPVALVVAESLATARDAAERVEVAYRPLPAVVGAREAVRPTAPQLCPSAPGNVVGLYEVGEAARVAAIMAGARHVVRLEVNNNRVVAFPLEPRTAIGLWDAQRGELTLRCSSQAAQLSRQLLAGALGLPETALHLQVGDVGGGFGARIVPYREDLLVLFAARRLGRPVRWRCERGEAFLSDTQGRDHAATLRLALDAGGRILAYEADVLAKR